MRKLKPEHQRGGSKRQEIMDKADEYLKNPKFGLQADKHAYVKEEVGLLESED